MKEADTLSQMESNQKQNGSYICSLFQCHFREQLALVSVQMQNASAQSLTVIDHSHPVQTKQWGACPQTNTF
jgi:hypothetical protein